MGVFTRSDHGLSNQKTFSDVDIIIYTEGGEISFNIDAILADDTNYNRQSIDIKFWDCILKKHNFKKRYKLKALGSKSCSNYFCEKIKNNEITGVAVFRDSDLDSILTTKYESNLICYTKGYSWENDVYSELVIIDYIESIYPILEDFDDIKKQIFSDYYKFNLIAKRLLISELIFRKNSMKLITSLNGEQFICCKQKPKFNKKNFLSKLSSEKSQLKFEKPHLIDNNILIDVCPILLTYGKLRAAFGNAIITYYLSQVNKTKRYPKEIIEPSLIDKYKSSIFDPYYENLVRKLES